MELIWRQGRGIHRHSNRNAGRKKGMHVICTCLYDQMDMSLPPEVGGRRDGCHVLSHRSGASGPLTGSQSVWLVTISLFSIEPIPFLVPPSPHDCGGGDNDDNNDDNDNDNYSDTNQHVYNTRKYCIRCRPRPCVHAFPHSAKPSTTPIGE
jgi:hypothetical protein